MSFIVPLVLAVLAAVTLLVPARAIREPGRATAAEPAIVVVGLVGPSPVETVGGTRLPIDVESLGEMAESQGIGDGTPDPVGEVAAQRDGTPPQEDDAPDSHDTADTPEEPLEIPVFYMPVEGVRVADVPMTFGDPRGSSRTHQGIDIVAERGTPVRAAAPGTVWRFGESGLGGLSVTILSDDGVRYFYTHLDGFAPGLERGQGVTTETVIGYVGNTGNAAGTSPHLHFEVSLPVAGRPYTWQPIDPLPHMRDR